MPPSSRGIPLSFRLPKKYSQNRRNITSSSQRDPRRIPAKPQALPRTKQRAEPLPTPEPEQPQPRWQWTPRFLRSRPQLRVFIYSFAIAFPCIGVLCDKSPFMIPRAVTGPSMRPTMNSDCTSDHDTNYVKTVVLAQKWGPNPYRGIQRRIDEGEQVIHRYRRGDIVVYSTPHNPERIAVKRVVALPGDTVVPLEGYEGGQDEVVVPYNHIWVEGDAGDRKLSMDSNYFGPICQEMVLAKVVATWKGWNVFGARRADEGENGYPAKTQGRVREDAVEEASADPNQVDRVNQFAGKKGQEMLEWLRDQPDKIEQRFIEDERFQRQVKQIWVVGRTIVRGHPDAEMRLRANDVVKELEKLLGTNALKAGIASDQKRQRKRGKPKDDITDIAADIEKHFAEAQVREDSREEKRKGRMTPAKAALQDMLEQQRKYGEMIDKEFEERDKVRRQREL